jgi:hypothetical protein
MLDFLDFAPFLAYNRSFDATLSGSCGFLVVVGQLATGPGSWYVCPLCQSHENLDWGESHFPPVPLTFRLPLSLACRNLLGAPVAVVPLVLPGP